MAPEARRNPRGDSQTRGAAKPHGSSPAVAPPPRSKPQARDPKPAAGASLASPLDALRAEFLAEARTPSQLPAEGPLEIALAGRSNVGKSTLLNSLAQRRTLARVSRTPGCTRGVILYQLGLRDGRALRVVDLPGYGYASRSHDERRGWGPLIEGYLTNRRALGGVVILVDARRGPEQEELDLVGFLSAHGVPVMLAATKVDKLSRTERASALARIARAAGTQVVGTSGETGEGREALLRAMLRWAQAPDASTPVDDDATTGTEARAVASRGAIRHTSQRDETRASTRVDRGDQQD